MAFLTFVSQLAAAIAAAVLKPRYFRKSLREAGALAKPFLASADSNGNSSLNSFVIDFS
jgi:hypothetical protein